MMLQALVAYADRERIGDPDFETRPVDYELRIDDSGSFVGLVPLGDATTRARLSGLALEPPSRNNPGFPCFVVDKAQYMLGVAKPNEKAGNAKKSFDSFLKLVELASGESRDPGLAALARFLRRPEEIAAADHALVMLSAKKPELRDGKVLVPVLVGAHAQPPRIHERPNVVAWWRSRREAERTNSEAGPVSQCLVTGRLSPIARTHGPLKGPPFPGTGAKLVSFDKDAFTSQGLEQGENAPIGELAARKYVAALNTLLEKTADGRRRSAVDLDAESVVVFWTRDASEAASFVLDLFAPPVRGSDAVEAVSAIWSGAANKNFDPTPFYAVTLGVNSARVVIRDWLETTAAAVKSNLDHWFEDLHIGTEAVGPLPLLPMLRALQGTPGARGDKRGLPPGLATRVFRAAVQAAPLPRSLLAAAVQRMRLLPAEREDARFVLRARVGLIKAVLIRDGKEVSVALDESNTDRAYLLGRLFAAIEKLQAVASGRGNDLNATIRDRYYGSASTTPASVFGRLLALSMHHASKAREDGLGIVAERAKADIMARLPAERFPRTLRLDEQGLFAVGYYHQREAFFRSRKVD